MHRKIRYIILGLLIITGVLGCANEAPESISLEQLNEAQSEDVETEKEDSIFVYVCGAVLYEGVYELPKGSRAYEAIEAAGGFTEDAAITQINQAEVLEDETQLYIPTIDEIAESTSQSDGKVNLNTATKEELMTLPGVGEAKANLIMQYRETNGRFQQIEDVMNISGIKEGLFAKIKDYIKV